MAPRIAVLGMESGGFVRRLARGLAAVAELSGASYALADAPARSLERAAESLRAELAGLDPAATVEAHPGDRRPALEGADYIVMDLRPADSEAQRLDVDIPLKYGVDQGAGRRFSAAAIALGQRCCPVVLDVCRDIHEVAGEDPLLFSRGAPVGVNTWTATHYGEVPCLGVTHGVEEARGRVAAVIEYLANGSARRPVRAGDVDVTAMGIDGLAWFVRVIHDGRDWCDRLPEGFSVHPVYSRLERVRLELLRHFGHYAVGGEDPGESAFAWFCRERDLPAGAKPGSRAPSAVRLGADASGAGDGTDAAREPVARAIEALETGRVYRGHFCVANGEAVANLPDDAIVAAPCYFDRNGVSVPAAGPLPTGCAAVCSQLSNVQRLTVEAAVEGDLSKWRQAVLVDPLAGAVCTPSQAGMMVDELLYAQRAWLPQYADEITGAKRRLAARRRAAPASSHSPRARKNKMRNA